VLWIPAFAGMTLVLRLSVFLPYLALDELAHGIAGQIINEDDGAGTFEGGSTP
jgi:hypothetical protein